MIIHNAAITGSLTLNGIDISDITGSEASVGALNAFSSSILSYTASNDARLTALNAQTASLLAYTSSNDARVAALNTFSSSMLSYTSSNDANILSLFANVTSLSAGSASAAVRINALNTFSASMLLHTASMLSYTASNTTNILSLNAAVAGLNSYTSSNTTNISSLNSYTSSANTRFAGIEASTASLNTFTSSINSRVTTIESKYATTGSNTFTGQQYISNTANANGFANTTGSFYTDGGARITKDMYVSGTAYFNNITVFGTQSVSYISSSQLNIGANIISVNTSTPTIRFGGLAVYDSGSTGLTGSILWDSQDNQWIYSNPSGSAYDSALFLVGPRSTGALGSEVGITTNALAKGDGLHHMTSSGIFESGSGNVGIGTSIPGAPLEIYSSNTFNTTTGANSHLILNYNSNTAGGPAIEFTRVGVSDWTAIQADLSGGTRTLKFIQTNAGVASTQMIIDANGGNVGIGTTTTAARLHVSGTTGGVFEVDGASAINALYVSASGNVGIGTITPTVTLQVDASGGGVIRATRTGVGSGYLQMEADGTNGSLTANNILYFNAGGSTRMTVLSNGNVGIGTTTPRSLFHANSGTVSTPRGSGFTKFFFSDNNAITTYFEIQTPTGSSGDILFSDGNSGDYGIVGYDHATDSMRFYTKSAINMFISGSGFVGIGTTSPGYKLDVSADVNDGSIIRAINLNSGAAATARVYVENNIGSFGQLTTYSSGFGFNVFGSSAGNFTALLSSGASSAGLLIGSLTSDPIVVGTDNTERMRITSGGNVGINTTSPGNFNGLSFAGPFLDVAGIMQIKGTSSNTIAGLQLGGDTYRKAIIYSSVGTDDPYFAIGVSAAGSSSSASERMRITSGGNVGIGTTSLSGRLHIVNASGAGQPVLELVQSNAGSNILQWKGSAGSYLGVIQNDGNVGIGTTSPAQKLSVYDGAIAVQSSAAGGGEVWRLTIGSTSQMVMNLGGASAFIYSTVASTSYGTFAVRDGYTNDYPAYTFINDTNTGMSNAGGTADTLNFITAGSERIRITSGGVVAIGTTTNLGGGNLEVQTNGVSAFTARSSSTTGTNGGTTVVSVRSVDSSASYWANAQYNAWQQLFCVGGSTEAMRITSGGNVGIGTTSPSGLLDLGAASNGNALTWTNYSNVFSEYSSGALWMSSNFYGNVGSSGYKTSLTATFGAAAIKVSGTSGAGNSGLIQFYVDDAVSKTAGASFTPTERMRIFSGGEVYINATTNPLPDNASPQLGITAKASTDAINLKHLQNGNNTFNIWQTGTTSHNAIAFYKGDTQTNRGLITVTTSGTTYNSVSDYRLKENITPLENGLDRLMQLKPSKFNWIETGNESEGFIAHELQEYFPDAVTGEKDAVYSSTGNIKPQSVDYGRITPLLVKALQELKAEFDEYKSTHP